MNNIFKKSISAARCLLLVMSFFGCRSYSKSGGITDGVQIKKIPSAIYTEEDINSAIQVILKEFKDNWKGCKLTMICYAGDNRNRDEGASEASKDIIVLTSSFDVDSSGGDGSLEANSTYDNWNWILRRDNGGNWRHIDHGY